MNEWRLSRGLFPQIVRGLCRLGFPGAKRLAVRKIRAEIEDERMEVILTACRESGKAVIGQEDENGQFVVRSAREKRAENKENQNG